MNEKIRKRLKEAKKFNKIIGILEQYQEELPQKIQEELQEINSYLAREQELLLQRKTWDTEPFYDNLENAGIYLCGYPGLSGTILLARYHAEELEKFFPKRFLAAIKNMDKMNASACQMLEAQLSAGKEVSNSGKEKRPAGQENILIYPLGEGGIRRTIYQLGKDTGLGFHIKYASVPVRQESIEICEFFDLDPWEVASWGACLIVADQTPQLVEVLGRQGIICSRIGFMTKDKDKCIIYKDTISRINRPSADGMIQVWQKMLENKKI